jgi:hypothetical protein
LLHLAGDSKSQIVISPRVAGVLLVLRQWALW